MYICIDQQVAFQNAFICWYRTYWLILRKILLF